MERRIQLMCACCGPAFVVTFVVGLWFVAGLVPPPSASDSADHIAAFYRGHSGQVRLGMLICMLGSVLLAPFVALISRQIRRSSERLELLADVQLICGVIGIAIVLLFELLMDRRDHPLHPRWVGFVSLLTAVLFALGGPTLWAMRGAFSWDGLLTFWVVLGSFGLWVSVMCWSMIRAIPPEGSGGIEPED